MTKPENLISGVRSQVINTRFGSFRASLIAISVPTLRRPLFCHSHTWQHHRLTSPCAERSNTEQCLPDERNPWPQAEHDTTRSDPPLLYSSRVCFPKRLFHARCLDLPERMYQTSQHTAPGSAVSAVWVLHQWGFTEPLVSKRLRFTGKAARTNTDEPSVFTFIVIGQGVIDVVPMRLLIFSVDQGDPHNRS